MIVLKTFILYAASIVGVHYLLGYCLRFMREKVFPDNPEEWESREWLVVFVGATERFMATTLVIFAPAYLAPFVGGWIALKYAANWQRSDAPFARHKSLFALIGTVWSFAFAITAGCFINPDALNYFAGLKTHGH